MQRLRKKFVGLIIRPLLFWYIGKNRISHVLGLTLLVPKGVFHPALFFSSKFLGKYVLGSNLKAQKVLDIGTGTGILALLASQRGAQVWAIDINPLSVEAAKINAQQNQLELIVLASDLFEKLHGMQFNQMLVNPPYYPKQAMNQEEMAWYCGPAFEYFQRLFSEAPAHLLPQGEMLMVLSEDCQLEVITRIANSAGWQCNCLLEKRIWGEKNYLFQFKFSGN